MSDWMAAAGGILGAAGSVASGIMNYQAQQDALAWQKAAQEKTWMREDTAVQRRTADLKAAGLNPVLAAGGAAQTGSPIQVRAPELNLGNPGGQLVNAASSVQSMHQSAAQVELLRQQAAKVESERQGQELSNQLARDVLPEKVSQAQSEAAYAVQTLASRVQRVDIETQSAGFAKAIEQAKMVLIAPQARNAEALAAAGLDQERFRAELTKAEKAATDARVPYTEAQTAALAYAVQAAGMNAETLRKLGVAPMVIDAVMKLLDTASRAMR